MIRQRQPLHDVLVTAMAAQVPPAKPPTGARPAGGATPDGDDPPCGALELIADHVRLDAEQQALRPSCRRRAAVRVAVVVACLGLAAAALTLGILAAWWNL